MEENNINPTSVVSPSAPWRSSVEKIIGGMALSAITFSFLCLNYILPTIGMVLMIIGHRKLRKANGWLKMSWIVLAIWSILYACILFLGATIYFDTEIQSGILTSFLHIITAAKFIYLFCFWCGVASINRAEKTFVKATPMVVLLLWYTVVYLMALLEISSIVIVIALVVLFFVILTKIICMLDQMEEKRCVIPLSDCVLSDRVIGWMMIAVLGIGLTIGYCFFSKYEMEWSITDSISSREVDEVKSNLIELGVPEKILDDLCEEDILACKSATQVFVDCEEHPVNKGREVKEQTGPSSYFISTVYDVKELAITNIAIKLDGAKEQWRIIHHFDWLIDPGYRGTEAIKLYPAYLKNDQGWTESSHISGQVLYDHSGSTYVAPYYSLGGETYVQETVFWGNQAEQAVFATFSFPKEGEHPRGYLSYEIEEVSDGWTIGSFIDYEYQRTWMQYPVMTAKDNRMNSFWGNESAFVRIQESFFVPLEELLVE